MEIIIIGIVSFLYFYAGYDAIKRIKKRDPEVSFAVDIIILIHGILSWIAVLAVQNLLFPDEELSDEQKERRIEYLEKQINILKNNRGK